LASTFTKEFLSKHTERLVMPQKMDQFKSIGLFGNAPK
jgi:hypothetical protein